MAGMFQKESQNKITKAPILLYYHPSRQASQSVFAVFVLDILDPHKTSISTNNFATIINFLACSLGLGLSPLSPCFRTYG